ncbi:hypothetical protein GF367_00200 [Candidatus Woesearchaeota archaeon]|nr:hypothetical protein [Candidatus Woesearchaeota archaeon]
MELKETLNNLLGYDGPVSRTGRPEVIDGCIDDITKELSLLEKYDRGGHRDLLLRARAANVIAVKTYALLQAMGVAQPPDVRVVQDDEVNYKKLSALMGIAVSYKHRFRR